MKKIKLTFSLLFLALIYSFAQNDTTQIGINPAKFVPPFNNPDYTTIHLPSTVIKPELLFLSLLLVFTLIGFELIFGVKIIDLYKQFLNWKRFVKSIEEPQKLVNQLENALLILFLPTLYFYIFLFSVKYDFRFTLILKIFLLTLTVIAFYFLAGWLANAVFELKKLSKFLIQSTKYQVILSVPLTNLFILLGLINQNLLLISLWTNFALLVLLSIFKYIRLFQAFSQLKFSIFLFILYLCSIEIAPILIAIKLIVK